MSSRSKRRLAHVWYAGPARIWEWANSIGLLGVGAEMLIAPSVITIGGLGLASDFGATATLWGLVVFVVGAVRLLGLWHNGDWPHAGPWIRCCCAGIGALTWGQMGAVLLLVAVSDKGQLPLGWWTYVMLVGGELVSAARAVADVPRRRN